MHHILECSSWDSERLVGCFEQGKINEIANVVVVLAVVCGGRLMLLTLLKTLWAAVGRDHSIQG